MNEHNDNIEDLEKELLELKKKKLQKKITDLEKDLGIPEATAEVTEHTDPVVNNRTTKKRKTGDFIPLLFLIGAALIVFLFFQNNFSSTSRESSVEVLRPKFLGPEFYKNNSREYTFNNRTGCIPILEFDLSNHPVLGQPGKTTFEVKIPGFDMTFRHSITNSTNGSVVLLASTNFTPGENLYSSKNFAGQRDITNEIKIYKEGTNRVFRVSPEVPEVIFGLEKSNNQVCDYRVNK